MPEKFKLKGFILDGLASGLTTIDEVIDTLAYPLINKGFIEPFLKALPKGQVEPDKARAEIERMVQAFIEPMRTVKAPFPVVLAILGGLLITVLPQLFGALIAPMSEAWFGHPSNAAFRPTLLTPDQLLEATRRGIIKDKGERDKFLSFQGVSNRLIDVLDGLQYVIPTVTDVIRFAVREAYSPAIAEKFGLYQEGADVYTVAKPDLDASGTSKDLFMKYWASHWELPSLNMAYDMLHRGIITVDDLKALMRAQDVSPYWRDKLLNLSYNVLTRVDVRRMHKLGVLSDIDLVKAYRDLGYDTENASKLAQFTIKYNNDPESMEETERDREAKEQRRYVIADVLEGYSTGLFNRDEAVKALAAVNVTPDHIDFLLQHEEYKKTNAALNKLIGVFRDNYLTGIWDEKTVQEELGKLALPSAFTDNLLLLWSYDKLPKPALPTKTDVMDWLKKGLITKDYFYAEMDRIGYDKGYIDLFYKEVKGAAA